MPTPSSTSEAKVEDGLRIHVFGHQSAYPEEVAHEFGGLTGQDPTSDCDLAIFAVNPSHGIDTESIAQWEGLNDSMVPRLVVVTGLENPAADFDDAVLLANRVFDQTVTPYLVLHDDVGLPCALISLEDLTIRDYTTNPPTVTPSDPEHQLLVSEFRGEYLEEMELMGEDAFAAGLLFPAIPLWLDRQIGVDIVKGYIQRLVR
ncbi:MAG TPA: hypothetical protein VF307_08460 [Candidatus Nanopelagicaceae bacterium]